MKTSLSILVLPMLLSGGFIYAAGADEVSPDVAAIGMLPKQRTAQRLAPSERNPFGFKPKELDKVAPEETETQESKIRAIFKAMAVSGVRRGPDGEQMALAGDLILREGQEVKPVLADQTELLMVSKIEPAKVELTFVENKDSTQPRTIVMPISNRPLVAQKLFAQPQGSRAMYYPAARAAAAGVASVLSVAGGSGVATPAQGDASLPFDASAGDVPSGIGVITARAPAVSSVGAAERQSFAALAPGGANGEHAAAPMPATVRSKKDGSSAPPARSPILDELGSPARQSEPLPKLPSVLKAPPPPVTPSKPGSPAPEPALPANANEKPSPLRLAVPPPSKAPPLIE